MAPPRFPEADKQQQASSRDLSISDDQISLLSLQPSLPPKDGCYASHGKAQEQLKKKVADRHDIYIGSEPGPNGCVYNYKFLWSDDLGVQLETPHSAAGLQKADAILTQRENAKREELAKTYGAAFGTPGEPVRNTLAVRNKKIVLGPPIIADRMPLTQLLGIEAAFKHSSPDMTPGPDSKPIKFYSSNHNQPENSLTAAEYSPPKDKQPAKITLFSHTKITPVTSESSRYEFAQLQKNQAELKALDPTKYKPLPDELNHFELRSIQQTAEHELAHHAEHRIGWDDAAKSDKFAQAIGWIPDPLFSRTDRHNYLLRGKNGQYYERTSIRTKDGKADWVGVDKDGLIQFGSDHKLAFYSGEEVAAQAAVKPSSTYFDSPREMMAESMSHLRDSAQSRRELLENDATLYFESKREDQLDINVTYGVNKLGAPNYIRDLDGQVIPNQPETLKTIAMFEERVQRAQKQKH